jgi:hypothetical protein
MPCVSAVVAMGALLVLSGCVDPPPRAHAVVDLDSMHRMLDEGSDWSPDQWEHWCDPIGGGTSRCLLTVEIACPPDCGVYVSMRQSPLARVVSSTAATLSGFP